MSLRVPAFVAPALFLVGSAATAGEGPELNLPGKRLTPRTVVLEADVACPPAESFELWSTRPGVESFYAPAARIGRKPGDEYTVMFFPDSDPDGRSHGTQGAHLLAAEPGRFISFEWVVFAGDREKGQNAPPYASAELRLPDPLPTWVEIHFQPSATGTHLRFRHYGFGDGELWGESHAWFTRAWSGVLTQMGEACDTPRKAPVSEKLSPAQRD